MDALTLKETLAALPLGGLRYFETIGSTNDEALAWAAQGAADFSLVVADEQTSGRGRLNRKWLTPARSALALSLILRPADSFRPYLSRVVGLAALSVAATCRELGLNPQIKWPNDVLVNEKKLAGILIENIWTGDKIEALVIGMGVNVLQGAVPPAAELLFPATSIESELGALPPPREAILRDTLKNFAVLREQIGGDDFLAKWGDALAFRGRQVEIRAGAEISLTGELLGLEADGSLQVQDAHGRIVSVRHGDVSLRAAA